jgi:hypothetical protein
MFVNNKVVNGEQVNKPSSRILSKEDINMSKSNAWEANSWEELQELVDLQDVLKALKKAEDQRIYHKTQYLKRQAILKIANEMVKDGRLTLS